MFEKWMLVIVLSLSTVDGKRLLTFQSQHELGELCMPGTCVTINANCKRVIGGSFRCVCKDQYLAINQTHCLRIIDPTIDDGCASCEEKHGICLDEDNDDHLDHCFCPEDNLLCHPNRTQQPIVSSGKSITTDFKSHQNTTINIKAKKFIDKDVIGDDPIVMNLYNIDQKQWMMDKNNQSIVTIHQGDHLYIDIKYRQNMGSSQSISYRRPHNQMIVDKCELIFNVTQKQQIMKRVLLLQHGCPSSIDFRVVDQDHVRSSIFSIEHTDEQRLTMVLECWIRLCLNSELECEQSTCSSPQGKSISMQNETYEMRATQIPFILQRIAFPLQNVSDEEKSSMTNDRYVVYSVMIGAVAVVFLVLVSLALFVIDRRCLVVRSSPNSLIDMMSGQDLSLEEKMRNQYEESSEYDLQDRWTQYLGHPNVVMTNIQPLHNERKLY